MEKNYHYKVTIGMPVYGVEKYIEGCAESLFSQTYKDIEYVFCDDCSPDKSIDVLQKVMERHPERASHIRIIQNERNKGSGGTRRHLLSEIRTEYFPCMRFDGKHTARMLKAIFEFSY